MCDAKVPFIGEFAVKQGGVLLLSPRPSLPLLLSQLGQRGAATTPGHPGGQLLLLTIPRTFAVVLPTSSLHLTALHFPVCCRSWDAEALLQHVATAVPAYAALIDTGALITGYSNLQVS
jgi:hypothetical protein